MVAEATLEARLRRRIRVGGPISLAEFMAFALVEPGRGYYPTRDPLGTAGDFVTAPEISQMFGELIGLWSAQLWLEAGRPAPLRLVELGPGRGTLMADLLRAAETVPGFRDALEVHLVELSPALRERQRERLGAAIAAWHDDLATVPGGPALVIANEFLDALPVHQYERTPEGWRERLLGLDEAGRLAFRLAGQAPPAALLPPVARTLPEGAVLEVSPAGQGLVDALARRLADDGGAALIIDYGSEEPSGRPSLQAVRAHRSAPLLEAPGTADLSAHVDFGALARIAREVGVTVHGPVPQGRFLDALGILARAERLAAGKTPEVRADLEAALERLTAPEAMGELFKVVALTAPAWPDPAGFTLR